MDLTSNGPRAVRREFKRNVLKIVIGDSMLVRSRWNNPRFL